MDVCVKDILDDYTINTETKPIQVTMVDNGVEESKSNYVDSIEKMELGEKEYRDHLLKLEEEGKKIKEEHDKKINEKIDLLNQEIYERNTVEQKQKDLIMRLKVISLYEMELNPLLHTNDLTNRQRRNLNELMNKYKDELTEEDIIKKFNEIVCEEILKPNTDVSKYVIYKA